MALAASAAYTKYLSKDYCVQFTSVLYEKYPRQDYIVSPVCTGGQIMVYSPSIFLFPSTSHLQGLQAAAWTGE